MATLVTRNGRTIAPATLGSVLGFDPFRNFITGYSPLSGADVSRSDDGGYRVEIPVPGYRPNEIDVTLDDGVLTVTGKAERRQFTRSLLLPDEIDADAIGAAVEHGMLTLTLGVHAKAQPKKIAVNFSA